MIATTTGGLLVFTAGCYVAFILLAVWIDARLKHKSIKLKRDKRWWE